jgi:cadmium resistance protein CadD (predicted permease)
MISQNDLKFYFYMGCVSVLHISYVFVYLGMGYVDKKWIQQLNSFVQIAVGLFLFVKFFPFRAHKLEPGDDAIIFGCSVFLLTNVGITNGLMTYVEKGLGLKPKFLTNMSGNTTAAPPPQN